MLQFAVIYWPAAPVTKTFQKMATCCWRMKSNLVRVFMTSMEQELNFLPQVFKTFLFLFSLRKLRTRASFSSMKSKISKSFDRFAISSLTWTDMMQRIDYCVSKLELWRCFDLCDGDVEDANEQIETHESHWNAVHHEQNWADLGLRFENVAEFEFAWEEQWRQSDVQRMMTCLNAIGCFLPNKTENRDSMTSLRLL